VDIAGKRWTLAALWLLLGLALKPVIAVMLAITAILYKPMRWRLVLGGVLLLASPFLTQHPAYVWAQYKQYMLKLPVAGSPDEFDYFSDIFGMIGAAGINIPTAIRTAVRIAAAVGALFLCRLALNRWGHIRGTLFFFGFNVCYLMLFNPRTENNTYVIAGMAMALFAAWALLYDRQHAVGGILVAMILATSASYEITRGINHWVCPGLCLIFSAYLTGMLLLDRPPAENPPAGNGTLQKEGANA
jgi:hypothetical protein